MKITAGNRLATRRERLRKDKWVRFRAQITPNKSNKSNKSNMVNRAYRSNWSYMAYVVSGLEITMMARDRAHVAGVVGADLCGCGIFSNFVVKWLLNCFTLRLGLWRSANKLIWRY